MATKKCRANKCNNTPLASPPANRAYTGREANGYFTTRHEIGKATRFKPGQSGNPSGRPKKTVLDYAVEQLLNLPAKGGKGSNAYRLAKAMFRGAIKGDVRFAQLIAERTGGKPSRQLQFEGKLETIANDPRLLGSRINELLAKRTRSYNETD